MGISFVQGTIPINVGDIYSGHMRMSSDSNFMYGKGGLHYLRGTWTGVAMVVSGKQ